MRDIQLALDMRPGSIYARFHSKEGLFTRVITHYAAGARARLDAVSQSPHPSAALRNFFISEVLKVGEHRFQRQCLLIKSLSEIDNLGVAAREAVLQGMTELHAGFQAVVTAISNVADEKSKTNAELQAAWLQEQFIGLRTLATYHSDARIEQLIDKLLNDLAGSWPDSG